MKGAFIIREVVTGITLDYEIVGEEKSLFIPNVYPDLASAMADIMVIRKHGERKEFMTCMSYDYIHFFEFRASWNAPLICTSRRYCTHQKVKKVLSDFYASLADAEVEVYA